MSSRMTSTQARAGSVRRIRVTKWVMAQRSGGPGPRRGCGVTVWRVEKGDQGCLARRTNSLRIWRRSIF